MDEKIAVNRHSDPFVGISRDEIIDLLLPLISRICTDRKDLKLRFDFIAGIGATALVKAYGVSTKRSCNCWWYVSLKVIFMFQDRTQLSKAIKVCYQISTRA